MKAESTDLTKGAEGKALPYIRKSRNKCSRNDDVRKFPLGNYGRQNREQVSTE